MHSVTLVLVRWLPSQIFRGERSVLLPSIQNAMFVLLKFSYELVFQHG